MSDQLTEKELSGYIVQQNKIIKELQEENKKLKEKAKPSWLKRQAKKVIPFANGDEILAKSDDEPEDKFLWRKTTHIFPDKTKESTSEWDITRKDLTHIRNEFVKLFGWTSTIIVIVNTAGPQAITFLFRILDLLPGV